MTHKDRITLLNRSCRDLNLPEQTKHQYLEQKNSTKKNPPKQNPKLMKLTNLEEEAFEEERE